MYFYDIELITYHEFIELTCHNNNNNNNDNNNNDNLLLEWAHTPPQPGIMFLPYVASRKQLHN